MNFKEFQQTRTHVNDLSEYTAVDSDMGVAGFYYHGGYLIYDKTDESDCILYIDKQKHEDSDIEVLEKKLFQWVVNSDCFDDKPKFDMGKVMDSLFEYYLLEQGLPENIYEALPVNLTPEQREFCQSFNIIRKYCQKRDL